MGTSSCWAWAPRMHSAHWWVDRQGAQQRDKPPTPFGGTHKAAGGFPGPRGCTTTGRGLRGGEQWLESPLDVPPGQRRASGLPSVLSLSCKWPRPGASATLRENVRPASEPFQSEARLPRWVGFLSLERVSHGAGRGGEQPEDRHGVPAIPCDTGRWVPRLARGRGTAGLSLRRAQGPCCFHGNEGSGLEARAWNTVAPST